MNGIDVLEPEPEEEEEEEEEVNVLQIFVKTLRGKTLAIDVASTHKCTTSLSRFSLFCRQSSTIQLCRLTTGAFEDTR